MFRSAVVLGAWLVLVLVPLSSVLAAGTPKVDASVSGYYALGSGIIPESEWIHIDVTYNSNGPLHVQARGEGGDYYTTCSVPCLYSPGMTSGSVQGFASADPGVLRVYGADMAIASPVLNAPNVPVTPNTDSVYTQIRAAASFTDYLHVDVPGMAVGTPVQVPMHYVAELVGTPGLGYPKYSAHPISVYVRFDIPGYGPQILSSEGPLFPFSQTTLPSGNTLYTIQSFELLVDARVGDELPISALIGISGDANIGPLSYTTQFGAFLDGRNTAGIWLGELPDGMVVTSASGHDYRLNPTVAIVPEPATVAMLLAGLGVVGFAVRRRAPGGSAHA